MTRSDLPPALRSRPPRRGETVVHLDYGLCRLGPLQRVELTDGPVDTVELRFRGGDTLNVPLTDAVRIWSYGASLPKSQLDKIGGAGWSERQSERMQELSLSLSAILAKRQARIDGKARTFVFDGDVAARAGQGFGHVLTDDQQAALDDVLTDLVSGMAMNRIVVGDVGCGKTEVAVRAALMVTLEGGMVRIVAPTRVLARQHYEGIRTRAEALGLSCALWSGDLTDGERSQVMARFGAGEIDILVGTHGLLSDRFNASDFALTVVDEEQKYGAKLKAVVDLSGHRLRLSATPIPRTLAEARVGLADVSLIETYPSGRGQTVTESSDGGDDVLRAAIDAELSRKGQVIILCARIKDIKPVRKRLKDLMPNAITATVHGGRKAKNNRAALTRFRAGEIDLLFATSMLETGIDVPSANTMLVFKPHRFGLAQLHQLRGRIGRSERDAHFLLVANPDKPNSKAFAKRVRALEQLDQRGDGLHLALADSLLRGTGRLDQDEQSGHASALGLEIYEYLLALAAEQPGASIAELLRSVPRIISDGVNLFGEAVALEAVLAGSRAALNAPDAVLSEASAKDYDRLLASCCELGAWKAAVMPDKVVLALAGGDVSEAASVAEIARRAASLS